MKWIRVSPIRWRRQRSLLLSLKTIRQTIRRGGNWRMTDDMANKGPVVTVAITSDVIAGLDLAIHHFRKRIDEV